MGRRYSSHKEHRRPRSTAVACVGSFFCLGVFIGSREPAARSSEGSPKRLRAKFPSDKFSNPMKRTKAATTIGPQKENPNESATSETLAETIGTTLLPIERPSRLVHVFYYAWYESRSSDGRWMHWNHENLPHWDARVNERYPHFRHDPDLGDVGSTFYPRLGAYSSRDAVVIEDHMKQLVKARAGTLVLSWFAPGRADPRTENVDTLVLPLLDAARTHGLELCLHLEPYEGRSAASARADVDYAVRRYGRHPAYHKSAAQGGQPVFYAYDSYQIPADEWAKSFPTNVGDKNWYVVGLVLHEGHLDEYVIRGPFDAGYSYFGAEGFTQAASPSRWRRFVEEAREAGKAFVPCVAPGYDDLRVRPWNGANSRPRNAGAYYDTMWTAAVESGARVVGVTSFNEWHEGTQIEASVPFSSSRDGVPPYEDYGSLGPEFYLDRTRHWVANFEQRAGL